MSGHVLLQYVGEIDLTHVRIHECSQLLILPHSSHSIVHSHVGEGVIGWLNVRREHGGRSSSATSPTVLLLLRLRSLLLLLLLLEWLRGKRRLASMLSMLHPRSHIRSIRYGRIVLVRETSRERRRRLLHRLFLLKHKIAEKKTITKSPVEGLLALGGELYT